MIKIGIIGATGFTGIELLRLLAGHPHVNVQAVTSNSQKGKSVTDVFPELNSYTGLSYCDHDSKDILDCDVVFFATPNATAMYKAPSLIESGIKIIDLSADFRLKNTEQWSKWYGVEHACPELLQQAVYGLPEQNRESIKNASLVANPGCYPTAIILALLPALTHGVIDTGSVIADAKSGISGAGRQVTVSGLYAEMNESFKAYAVSGHRHLPEICQALNHTKSGEITLTFVPHLVPMVRGIHATVYASIIKTSHDLSALYAEYYRTEPFVNVLANNSCPSTRSVKGTNLCKIAVHSDEDSGRLIVLSVIDNLVKGASGQAIQNMNLMFGFDETAGLTLPAFYP